MSSNLRVPKDSEVRKILERLEDRLHQEFNKIQHDQGLRPQIQQKKLNSIKARLHNILGMIEHLPDSLELGMVSVQERRFSSASYSQTSAKKAFLKKVIRENADALINAIPEDLDNKQLSDLMEGHVPVHPDGGYYDISLEHIIPRNIGGGHRGEDNLCLYPTSMNFYANKLVGEQLPEPISKKLDVYPYPLPDEVLIITPKKVEGRIPAVPEIPGGFQKDDPTKYKKRASEIFGFEFK